jgi:6-phosphofructokinase 2
MSNILTVTFNPCIDKSTTVASLAPEKKLKCSTPTFEPGGGGINVARAIKKLGGNATAIYPAGGYSGQFLQSLLQKEEIDSLVIKTEKHTRENLIVLDISANQQYRFGMPGQQLSKFELEKCLQLIEENTSEFIVASGSLPPGVPTDIFATISKIAKLKNKKLIVDSSGEALEKALDEGVYMIKPNVAELSKLAGEEELTITGIENVAHEIIKRKCCEVIVVSMGPSGAMMVTNSEVYTAMPPLVKRRSTVGAGDSMVAGIVYSLSENKSLKEALYFGVACGTAATMNAGTQLCNLTDVQVLYRDITALQMA